jgi:hypothetical protein
MLLRVRATVVVLRAAGVLTGVLVEACCQPCCCFTLCVQRTTHAGEVG